LLKVITLIIALLEAARQVSLARLLSQAPIEKFYCLKAGAQSILAIRKICTVESSWGTHISLLIIRVSAILVVVRTIGGGWCRPLDEIDFETKDAFPKTRWPIGKKTLDSYLAAASGILEVRALQKDVELSGGLLKQIDVVFTNAVRFSQKYASELLNSQSIAVALNASVVELKNKRQRNNGCRSGRF